MSAALAEVLMAAAETKAVAARIIFFMGTPATIVLGSRFAAFVFNSTAHG
jgi:hypothetical protein